VEQTPKGEAGSGVNLVSVGWGVWSRRPEGRGCGGSKRRPAGELGARRLKAATSGLGERWPRVPAGGPGVRRLKASACGLGVRWPKASAGGTGARRPKALAAGLRARWPKAPAAGLRVRRL